MRSGVPVRACRRGEAIEPSEHLRCLALAPGAHQVLAPGEDDGPPPRVVIECTGASVEIDPYATLIRREVTYTGVW